MSWHYSQVLVEHYWGENSLDGEPCAQSRSMSIAGMCWSLDKTTDVSTRSRSGMTYEPLTDDRGGDVLSWFMVDFLARTSPVQARKQESEEKRVVFGPKCGGLLARFSPPTKDCESSLRTPQTLLFSEERELLRTLPRWGSIVAGELWEHTMPAMLLTSGTESGSWATPTAKANQLSPYLIRTHPGCRKLLPTPSANEDAAGTPDGKMQPMLGNHPAIRGTTQEEWDGGTLNPDWVEWMMGWVIGWTSTEPLPPEAYLAWRRAFVPEPIDSRQLETDRCLPAQHSRGGS